MFGQIFWSEIPKKPFGTHLPQRLLSLAGTALVALGLSLAEPVRADTRTSEDPADLVVTNALVHTSDGKNPDAQALAIRDGKFVYVGSDAGVKAFIGPHTIVRDEQGARILPGLVDAHVHPVWLLDRDMCDLQNRAMSLVELRDFIKGCILHYNVKAGHWLDVEQWNYAQGNTTAPNLPDLRAALDAASPDVPIQVFGNDGHHGAFNSAALTLAHDARGKTIGLSAATLGTSFATLKAAIGMRPDGEPNGAVDDQARDIFAGIDDWPSVVSEAIAHPDQILERFSSSGITAILDADVTPDLLPFYDKVIASGKLNLRANLALDYNPEDFARPDGTIDYDAIVTEANKTRAKYAAGDQIKADTVKLYADGTPEGNPLIAPPAMPNAPSEKPYLQPIFKLSGNSVPQLTGYVDLDGPTCVAVRTQRKRYDKPATRNAFLKLHGYYPSQCQKVFGRYRHDPAIVREYFKRMHAAGYTLHVHAISAAGSKLALDAIEGARAADGRADLPDAIAHVVLVDPSDIARFGRNHILVAGTYSWAFQNQEYDLTVIPFIDRIADSSLANLHAASNFYEQNVYPFRALRDAGAILTAGSDAPVFSRDPRPFLNMEIAVTRTQDALPPLAPQQAISLLDVVTAYTINGARQLRRDNEIGSITIGKSADFIVLNQDIFNVKASFISKTRVKETIFRGKTIFIAAKN